MTTAPRDFASCIPMGGILGQAGGYAGGRHSEGTDVRVVSAVRAFCDANGRAPSLNWVYRQAHALLGSGYDRARARRVIAEAQR